MPVREQDVHTALKYYPTDDILITKGKGTFAEGNLVDITLEDQI